jgi:hypothetical protein
MLSFAEHFEKESVVPTMKKVISISLTFLMLTALLHFSVATHYCGSTVAGSRISLSGKLATCGMESGENELPLTGLHFTRHCCDNVLLFCGINGNYFPSFSFVPESYQTNFKIFSIPADITINTSGYLRSTLTSAGPPEILTASSVDLSTICILRI